MDQRFRDRRHAGQVLAARLAAYRERPGTLVLALPRGGVPVAFEVARALGAPLDVFLARKLGAPGRPELGMGAIASGGLRVLNEAVIREIGVTPGQLDAVAQAEGRELLRRERSYRGDRPPPAIAGRTVILVDDGMATGATMRVAALALRQMGPRELVVAVPVAAAQTCAALRAEADEVVCAVTPASFMAVGAWYEDFTQTTDDEVRDLLARARAPG